LANSVTRVRYIRVVPPVGRRAALLLARGIDPMGRRCRIPTSLIRGGHNKGRGNARAGGLRGLDREPAWCSVNRWSPP
jgi:hypothetical protein